MQQNKGFLLAGSSLFSKELPLFVNRVEEGFDLRLHFHDYIEITYVAEGKGFHYVGGETLQAQKGDLFIVPRDIPHVFRPGSADPKQRLVVYNAVLGYELWEQMKLVFGSEEGLWSQIFGGENGKAAAKEAPHPGWIMIRRQGEELNALFQEFYYEYVSRNQGRRASLLAYAIRLFIMTGRAIDLEGHGEERKASISGIIDYIRHHYNEPLSLEDMAWRCGLSGRHFFRLFRQGTGQTFMGFVQGVRIEAACKLLRQTDMKILSIAEAVGYKDVDSFYRVLKLHTGYPPGEYRKSKGM
jgi:AraC family transcriptional regulator, L-rhamnose operon transcriptional activator RhaR